MSLLGTPVYANPATPLWLSSGGSTVTGDITLVDPASVEWIDASGNITGRIVGVPTPPDNVLYIQNDYEIAFGQVGSSQANTRLAIDAYGGQDLLDITGQVSADSLALLANQSLGVARIDIGNSGVTVTFTNPMLANPYIFLTHAGSPSGGPAKGQGQGTPIVNNVSTTGFTISLVDGDGITQVVADANVFIQWMAVIPG